MMHAIANAMGTRRCRVPTMFRAMPIDVRTELLTRFGLNEIVCLYGLRHMSSCVMARRLRAVDIAAWQVAVITPDGVARSTRCELFGLPSSISRQLPRSPMLLFARRVKHALDVAVQRPHDADAREHRWPCSATNNGASIAACHSSASCFAFGSLVMYRAASRNVRRVSPSITIGSKNS